MRLPAAVVCGHRRSMTDLKIAKRGVQSIDVGIRILQSLSKADAALSLTAVGRASGVPSSSCHRYLTSFIKAGFVKQDAVSGRYDLGPGIIESGLAALRRTDPVVIGLRTCEELAQATGRTAQLAIWSDEGPVIVSWRMGSVPVPTNLSVGSRLPLLNSATGRVFATYLPRSQWEPVALKEGHSIADVQAVIDNVRTLGVAAVEGSVIPGLSAAAVPLLDARGAPAAVVALLGLRGDVRPRDRKKLVEAMTIASAELGAGATHPI